MRDAKFEVRPFLTSLVFLVMLLAPAPARLEENPAKGAGVQALAEEKEKPRAKEKPKGAASLEWFPLDLGLAKARPKLLPVIVLFEPDAGGAGAAESAVPPASFLDEHADDTSTRGILKRFVLIRVGLPDLSKEYPKGGLGAEAKKDPESKPAPGKAGAPKGGEARKGGAKGQGDDPVRDDDPPAGDEAPDPEDPQDAGGDGGVAPAADLAATVAARLGISGEKPALVVMNYWEEVALSYSGELPTRSELRKHLDRFWKVNGVYAATRRKMDPELEKSRYAFKLGNMREAVLKVVPLEDEKQQNLMDPFLKKRVNELIQDYRAKSKDAIAAANKLDTAEKFDGAIKAFDAIMRDFPFRDVMLHAAKRKGEVLRKWTFGR
ncbi:MAG TPA: hypothetical protein VMT52_03775 [Planctomycetota bacterium]|nr:hypothetical protein [Planctomycetota bacterium]